MEGNKKKRKERRDRDTHTERMVLHLASSTLDVDLPTFRVVFSFRLNLSGNIHTDMPESVSLR